MKKQRAFYEYLSIDKPICFNQANTNTDIVAEIPDILEDSKNILHDNSIKYATTWILEKDLWVQHEKGQITPIKEKLSRGRIVLVNPGVSGIGREQRYMHNYIVLGEYQETFIGVPVTNMAYNDKTREHYLRNFFEVELIDPETEKKFNEYRCSKPSVADVRNIAGLDKRRIIQNDLYHDKKFVPNTYLNAISEKIRSSLAIIQK